MAGIYGDSPEDRYREQQLDEYLDQQETPTAVMTFYLKMEVTCPHCKEVNSYSEIAGDLPDRTPADLATLSDEEMQCGHCNQYFIIDRVEFQTED